MYKPSRLIKKYSSKFSKKTYTQWAHCVIVLLMKRLKVGYEKIIEMLSEMPNICKILGIKAIIPYKECNILLKIANKMMNQKIYHQRRR